MVLFPTRYHVYSTSDKQMIEHVMCRRMETKRKKKLQWRARKLACFANPHLNIHNDHRMSQGILTQNALHMLGR